VTLNDNPGTPIPPGAVPPTPADPVTGGSEPTTSSSIINRLGAANWAKANLHSGNNGYNPDCTDFVSRAMRFGGHDPMSPWWDVNLWWDDHFWFTYAVRTSYSWGGAFNLSDHLWLIGSQYRRYLRDGQTGEVIFANWNNSNWTKIDHVAVLWRVASNGFLMVLQHSPTRFEPLSYWMQANPHLSLWLAVPNRG
jgi:hypothetical protein